MFRIFGVLIVIFSAFSAWSEHSKYLEKGDEVVVLTGLKEKEAGRVARDSMADQQECLLKDPGNWCNRDLKFSDYYRSALTSIEKHRIVDYSTRTMPGHREKRNEALTILMIAAAFTTYAHWRMSFDGTKQT